MIWNNDVLFIHVPKTGGMSVTDFLERALEPPVFASVPPGHENSASLVTFVPGTRHERLYEAEKILASYGRDLSSFKVIIAGMRNPYEMEVSRFHHIKTHFFDQPLINVNIIKNGGFEAFVRDSNFYGKTPPAIEEFYTLRGDYLPNLKPFRTEDIEGGLRSTLAGHADVSVPLPHINKTEHDDWRSFITPEAEEAIYTRFKWLFDHGGYARLLA